MSWKTIFPCKLLKLYPLKNCVSIKHKNCKSLTINLATTLGSKYVYETTFSETNFLKNKYHLLERILHINFSPCEPNYKNLAQDASEIFCIDCFTNTFLFHVFVKNDGNNNKFYECIIKIFLNVVCNTF